VPLLQVANALEDGADDQGESNGGVFEDFGKLATFFRWDKFAPRDGFGVRTAAQSTPVDRFGTDANAVGVALERKFFVAAASHEFSVHTKLLRPVSGDTPTNGEDAHFPGGHHDVGEGLEIFEGIEAEKRALVALARVFVQGEIETEFGVAEGGDEDGDIVLESGAKDAAATGGVVEKCPDAFVELPATHDFFGIPLFEDTVNYLLDVIKISFRLEGIVDAIVASEEEFIVVHFRGIVTEVGTASSFDESVSHESASGDDGFDDARVDEITEDQAHFANSESASKGHDDKTVLVASHGFEDVGGIADLAGGVGGVAHGTDQIVDGLAFGKIERKDGAEFVLYGIVKNAARNCLAGMLRHRGSSWGGYECGVTGNRNLLGVVYSKSRCGYQKSEMRRNEIVSWT
jgi:hypothetical protein